MGPGVKMPVFRIETLLHHQPAHQHSRQIAVVEDPVQVRAIHGSLRICQTVHTTVCQINGLPAAAQGFRASHVNLIALHFFSGKFQKLRLVFDTALNLGPGLRPGKYGLCV